jgi:colanic acid biosynthesis glycosyl transferase WcaI
MRILVIGINYAPERTSVAPFTTGLCEHLVRSGNDVTAVTAFPYYPEWKVWEGYRGSLYRKERINGVEVRRVAHFVPSKPSNLFQRMAYDLSFTLIAFIAALFTGKCDLIYCSCPPPTVAFAAYLLGKVKRAPYVMKVTDLASDAAVSTGIMRNRSLVRLARLFEAFTYRQAQSVICLCQGFIDRLTERGVPPEKLQLIPDWGDTKAIRPQTSDRSFRQEHAIPQEAFLVLHTGNMGKKQDLGNVVRAAQLSRSDTDLLWILVGQGEERDTLEQEIVAHRLANIRLLPLQPPESLSSMYAAADALLVNQKKAVEDAVIPSKLLTYMAAGRPVVAAVSEKSETARQVSRANCGVIVPAEDPRALADALLALRSASAFCQRLGKNGRAYAEANFTKDSVLERYDKFLAQFGHPAEELVMAAHPGARR